MEEPWDPAFERNFLLCPFGSVESFAKSGQMDRALKHWRTLLDLAGPLLLFSEGFDPASNRPLGNYLQALTHIGVLGTAFALGLVGSEDQGYWVTAAFSTFGSAYGRRRVTRS